MDTKIDNAIEAANKIFELAKELRNKEIQSLSIDSPRLKELLSDQATSERNQELFNRAVNMAKMFMLTKQINIS